MKRHLALLALLLLAGSAPAQADTSWIFAPSRYSHDPATGQRVTQYAPPATPYLTSDPTYLRSGYHHSRTSFQFGNISDNLHVVETWGAGASLRPYGEWLRPFRAGATPYGPWGNPQGPWTTPYGTVPSPYGQVIPPNSGYGYGYGYGYGNGYGYPGASPMPYAGQPPPGQPPPIPPPPQAQPPRSSETNSQRH